MLDYGRDPTFGYFLIPNAADPLLDAAREIEARGLDWIGVQDHPYQRRFVDTWALLGAIAAATTQVGFFPDVANLPLRPPAIMAKAAASLDVLSGGRFELGLGAGGFWDAVEAYGGPRREPRDALDALEEAIQRHSPDLEWRAQPALHGHALPSRRRTLRAGTGPSNRYLARRLPARGRCGSPAGWRTAGCRPCAVRSPAGRGWGPLDEMPQPRQAIRRRSAAWSTSTARSPMAPDSASARSGRPVGRRAHGPGSWVRL